MLNTAKIKRIFRYYLPALIKSKIAYVFPLFFDYFCIKPHFAVLNITDNCCFKCIMCGQWKGKSVNELHTKEWCDVLIQLKDLGVNEIVLSGGEPFMRIDLIDIVAFAKQLNFKIGVITNGHLLDREKIKSSIESGVSSFSISLDAINEKFDNIRGVKGAYEKVMSTCEILSEYKKGGLSVDLYFTLMKTTLDHYKDVYAIAEKFNFPFVVNLFDFTPYFFKSLKPDKDNFWIDNAYDSEKLRNLQLDFISRKNKNSKSLYHTYTEIEYFRRYFNDPLQEGIPCVVSQQRIGIDPQGNVYGGCWSMHTFGNLKEKSLKEIINSYEYKSAHKSMFFKKCPGCSCGYSKNLRYHLPTLITEALYRLMPHMRRRIGGKA